MPIRSDSGAYISIVSAAILFLLFSSEIEFKVRMLCSRSANFTSKTRISLDVANISFLIFSALEFPMTFPSNAEIFVTPSTKSATSFPNSFCTVL